MNRTELSQNIVSPEDGELILIPSYFIDYSTLALLMYAKNILLDVNGSYAKQTYRNRMYIAGANGKMTLNIPVIHNRSGDTWTYQNVEIDHSYSWQTNHLKSIKSAYHSSPFYEYYEHLLLELFAYQDRFLYQWNLRCLNWTLHQLGWQRDVRMSIEWQNNDESDILITAKKPVPEQQNYGQVFQEKHGFMAGLGFLDMLFNLGPSVTDYLLRATDTDADG